MAANALGKDRDGEADAWEGPIAAPEHPMGGLNRLKALLGRADRGPRHAGWVRVDADDVVRGWAVDRRDPAARPVVEVLVDGQAIGRARADRFDARLKAAGEGDGLHAFAILVPARWRDGRPHRIEALVAADGYRLQSKADAFTIPADVAEPRLTVTGVAVAAVTGQLAAGQYAPDIELEVWSAGRRLDGTRTVWRQRGPRAEFEIALPPDALFALDAQAVVAAPGMYEAGVGAARLFAEVKLQARPGAGGVLVSIGGPLDLPPGAQARLIADGQVLASVPFDQRGEAQLMATAPAGASVVPVLDGRPLAALETPVDLDLPPLVANPCFRGWSGQGPDHWSVGEAAAEASRGFYAFPAPFASVGLGGDLVRLDASGAGVLLRQSLDLADAPAGGDASLSVVVRCSEPAALQARLLDGAGAVVGTLDIDVAEGWSWTRATASMRIEAGAAAVLELVIVRPVDWSVSVEVAGVQLGGSGFRDRAAGKDATPVNLVENGDLLDWPKGLDIEASGGRMETAAGWFVQNRKGAGSVRVRALSGNEGVALVIAGSGVGDYCRLEARLHPAARRAGPRLRLSFEAAIPTDAPRAFQGAWPVVVIERIFLLRRGRRRSGGADVLVSEAVAMLARRITVAREPRCCRLDVDLDADALSSGDLEDVELFVAFDLSRDFALSLRDLQLVTLTESADAGPRLELEDPAVALQARSLKGLAGWLSPGLVEPGLRFAADGEAPATDLAWQWPANQQGSVEVVICVHDAADDALACLASLVGASALPHTVRVIDDGSGEDTHGRLVGFVAGKPWMRLVRNPRNLGYTASANIGVRSSGADWVVLLNSDTIVSPGWLEGLLECAASASDIAFVGPVSNAASYQSVPELKDRSGSWKINALPPGWTPRRMAAFVGEAADKNFPRVPLLNGFCTLIRRDAFLALGGLNEVAFPQGYGEENDLCVRAGQAGYGLAVADHVYVHHAKSASFGDSRRRELQKAAGQALAKLHPDVDFAELGDRVREAAALVRLREMVRALYEAES